MAIDTMLRYIRIDRLFGLYSYTLDFSETDGLPVRFVTGPNGYGKTTLLSMVTALFSGDFESFFSVVFDEVEFGIGADVVRIRKIVHKGPWDDSFSSSFGGKKQLKIHVERDLGDISKKEDYELSQGGSADSLKGLVMYFSSFPYYYVRDRRLTHKAATVGADGLGRDVPAADDNAMDLSVRLSEEAASINRKLQTLVSHLDFSTTIDEAGYIRKSAEVLKSMERLKEYGLVPDDFRMYSYDDAPPAFLSAYMDALDKVVSGANDFVCRLDAFRDIVRRFDFADKEMEISPRFGYRFVLRNDSRTILMPSSLSSGEQHMLIMSYELLFRAQDRSLVLIDEPEISFHLAWQSEFLQALAEIVRARGNRLQCVVATHSPQIFDNRWSMTEDLYSQNAKTMLK